MWRATAVALALTAGFLIGGPPASAAQAPGELAQTPPMGWNSWNKFACDIDEELIRETADAMVSTGMKAAGYEYVNIDDCWMAPTRTADGRLQADPVRFPSGIKALADYVHARGLKLGIYSSAGLHTCQGLPASLGNEEIDAQSFADWEVDYLKYDNCGHPGLPGIPRYKAMADALAKTGRPIVYSVCEWGSEQPWLWADGIGADLWRTTGDISDNWSSVMSLLDQQVGIEQYARQSGWNDPDMLEVGNGGLTPDESRAHMSLWALLNAPLLAGNDLRSVSAADLAILTDPEVIAVNQDWGGRQGSKLRDDGATEVWAKPMSSGGVAVVLLNRDSSARTISASAASLGLAGRRFVVRDLWADTSRESSGVVRASVPSHGAAMFVVAPYRGPVLAPLVTLGLDVAAYAKTGANVPATLTLFNDGTSAATSASVSITPPSGWTSSPAGPARIAAVPPRGSAARTFTLTPGVAAPGEFDLAVRGSWTGRGTVAQAEVESKLVVVDPLPEGDSYLSDVPWAFAQNGWGPAERDRSNGEQGEGDGNPLTIAGQTWAKGIGVHAVASLGFFTGGDCSRFAAMVGVDDEEAPENRGSVAFEVWGDGVLLAKTPTLLVNQPAVPLSADLTGVDLLELRATDGGDGVTSDHGDWADAKVSC
ncbi:NPCBM/NEW2 domain-containing protein [Tenggerimyces flavus]|uniref:Alpha-galactosidase n=1 Tax=Tenggerimyces flavus TaxID=1708749 RepID=A0ABV7YND1_9ACTN|nr:NPCBM/NEW2 domain-containing protein [Tenggerimyces flavus]MBM7789532.1 alpha-galactosidase [Tenggerimyces flavus]